MNLQSKFGSMQLAPNVKPNTILNGNIFISRHWQPLSKANYTNLQLSLTSSDLSLSLTDSSIDKKQHQHQSQNSKKKYHKSHNNKLYDQVKERQKQNNNKHQSKHKISTSKQNKQYNEQQYHSSVHKGSDELKQRNEFTHEKHKRTHSLQKCPCCGKKINKLCFHCPHLFCKVETCTRKKKQRLNHRMLVKLRHSRYQQLKQNSQLDEETIRRKFRIQPIEETNSIISEDKQLSCSSEISLDVKKSKKQCYLKKRKRFICSSSSESVPRKKKHLNVKDIYEESQ